MKRAFSLLLVLFFVLYGKLGYDLFAEHSILSSSTTGSLSDIAKAVTAIPLRTSGTCTIERARSVQKEGDNLFLISDDVLYRFDTSGKLICSITDPAVITVAGYLIDPLQRRLIVMGNEADVHFYSFTGELLADKKLKEDESRRRIHTAALFNNRIWTTEEYARFDKDTQTYYIERQVVEYDSSFQKLQSHHLVSADLYNTQSSLYPCTYELGVSPDTGCIYAYTPAIDPSTLLRDTLLLKRQQTMHAEKRFEEDITVYPLRFGQRYWLSAYQDPVDPSRYYTFCFDQDTCKSWHIEGGFKDNFYHTGAVRQLQPIDVYSNSYYFCKPGNESENAVIFIVELKV